jgi:hypothetical protein
MLDKKHKPANGKEKKCQPRYQPFHSSFFIAT